MLREKHGQSRTPLYFAWVAMRQRCLNPRHKQWKDWGGRGIRICKRWDKFENFAADMGPHPGKGWSLDRINNDKGYSKFNCRWATRAQQTRNRRTTKLTVSDVATIRATLQRGRGPYDRGNAVQLAKRFGVSRICILQAGGGLYWQ